MNFLSSISLGDWAAIIEQNEIFREQNEIIAAQAAGKPTPPPRIALNRWLIYRPVIALLAIAVLVWVTLAYDAYDKHAPSSQWRPWWIALLVDIGLVFAYSVYTHRRVLAFEKQRRVERSQIVTSYLGEISKLTPVIHWAYWRTKNIKGLLVTEVLQRRLKDSLILKADNAFLEVTPQTDPAVGEYKHLQINYSYGTNAPVTIKRWENAEFVLPVDPWLEAQLQKAEKEWIKPIAGSEIFKVQRMQADPVAIDPSITFKNKLRMDITNITGKEIYVWMPLWESSLVPSQSDPTGSRLFLERTQGSWRSGQWVEYQDGKTLEHCCVKLREDGTFETWVGLLPHAQENVAGLLKRHGTIGTVLFPVKMEGKMYEIRVPAKEV